MGDNLNFDAIDMQPDEIDMVIYHGECVDGFTSALCVYEYFKQKNKEIIYYPGAYNKAPPLKIAQNKNVLLCDFSYKRSDLAKLQSVARKILILDHHKSAEIELADFPNNMKIFNMSHSGSYITYKYFNRTENIPLLITYVEDNDIWLKKQPQVNEFTAYMSTVPYKFAEYAKLLDDNFVREHAFTQGTGMLALNNTIIRKTKNKAVPKFIQIKDKYYFVAHLNSTVLKSELGNILLSDFPNVNFTAIYSMNDFSNSTVFSLRSQNTASDVSQIATLYGGGGHRNASGITVSYITNTIPSRLIDTYQLYSNLSSVYIRHLELDCVQYNIVLLNSNMHYRELGIYLLQNRYDNIQEGISIYMNNNDYKNVELDNNIITLHVSVIWHYDGYNDKTQHCLTFNDNTDNHKIMKYICDKTEYKEYNNQITFALDGYNIFFQ